MTNNDLHNTTLKTNNRVTPHQKPEANSGAPLVSDRFLQFPICVFYKYSKFSNTYSLFKMVYN